MFTWLKNKPIKQRKRYFLHPIPYVCLVAPSGKTTNAVAGVKGWLLLFTIWWTKAERGWKWNKYIFDAVVPEFQFWKWIDSNGIGRKGYKFWNSYVFLIRSIHGSRLELSFGWYELVISVINFKTKTFGFEIELLITN